MPPTRPNRPPRPARQTAARASLDAATITIADDSGGSATVPVDLLGVRYQVTPPKSAAAMRVAWLAAQPGTPPDEIFAALDQWMDKAFGDQADEVRRRLYEDDNDPLDFPHIMALIGKLVELTSDLPTTRR